MQSQTSDIAAICAEHDKLNHISTEHLTSSQIAEIIEVLPPATRPAPRCWATYSAAAAPPAATAYSPAASARAPWSFCATIRAVWPWASAGNRIIEVPLSDVQIGEQRRGYRDRGPHQRHGGHDQVQVNGDHFHHRRRLTAARRGPAFGTGAPRSFLFSIPGETVDVEIVRNCERYVETRLLAVREPSPARVEPDCPYFGRCGRLSGAAHDLCGNAAAQTPARRGRVHPHRGHRRPDVRETLPMPSPLRCRNKMEYAIAEGKIGFIARRQPRGRARRGLPVAARGGARAVLRELAKIDLRGLRGAVTRVNHRGEVMLTLCGTGKEPPIREFPGVASL